MACVSQINSVNVNAGSCCVVCGKKKTYQMNTNVQSPARSGPEDRDCKGMLDF